MLEFVDVSYTYPGVTRPAINGLTLSIPVGQKSVIIGHNGCGKSTLLFLADGLYRCDRGTISWNAQPLSYDSRTLNRWRQRIGLSFQDPEQQLVAGTVAEDISYGLYNLQLSLSEIEQRLHQTLIDFALQDLANQPLHHLSLGQKRRVALAGVMALQPDLLLLDEPTTYLDNCQSQNFLQEIERIHKNGTTIVMATHDLNLAYAWADWVFVLHEGKLALSGQPQDVFKQKEVLERLQIGVPLLVEVWEALSLHLKAGAKPPQTVDELKAQIQKLG